jgi:hypothetical protein
VREVDGHECHRDGAGQGHEQRRFVAQQRGDYECHEDQPTGHQTEQGPYALPTAERYDDDHEAGHEPHERRLALEIGERVAVFGRARGDVQQDDLVAVMDRWDLGLGGSYLEGDVVAAVVARREMGLDHQAFTWRADLRIVAHAVLDAGDRGVDVGVGHHPEVGGITSRPQSHQAKQGKTTRHNDAQRGPADRETLLAAHNSTPQPVAHR